MNIVCALPSWTVSTGINIGLKERLKWKKVGIAIADDCIL